MSRRGCARRLQHRGGATHDPHGFCRPSSARCFQTWTQTPGSTHKGLYESGKTLSSFTEQLADPEHRVQSYVSSSSDPYFNLAIEDHILSKSSAKSTILFLYVNRPCVVIGRNQNPWTEVNLHRLDAAGSTHHATDTEPPSIGTVDLVRRRSGGGAVFHDEGNLNWSVTTPRKHFTRDKHAEMTVRALRQLGVERARVNERHDIVLDQGHTRQPCDPRDTHRTPYQVGEGALPRPLKVSGSAYKLVRDRAIHHATTLLSSPNLHVIPQYLRSPAKKFIQANGVESVSSPVGNIGLEVPAFQQHMQKQFAAMYGSPSVTATLTKAHLNLPSIGEAYGKLRNHGWIWSQTPKFDVTLDSSDDVGVSMHVHSGGFITKLKFTDSLLPQVTQQELRNLLVGQNFLEFGSWESFLKRRLRRWDEPVAKLSKRLDEILFVPKPRERRQTNTAGLTQAKVR
ncbi:hypothetical protein T440DRAFT_406119 [Plenodomus tracheiphilus IPT5]|uniref:Putative lipoate-protein ligase A n=1 Tax=Plenodomus tracheiphilus IPT5 TaxID=1408161 RepID=A0A6A7AU41_9PLEO|nr:hypothetical protein T440DRAFT_406119 [Plenodomus tracheiphilus IPT5]